MNIHHVHVNQFFYLLLIWYISQLYKSVETITRDNVFKKIKSNYGSIQLPKLLVQKNANKFVEYDRKLSTKKKKKK